MKALLLFIWPMLLSLGSRAQAVAEPAPANHRWVVGLGALPILAGQWQLEAEWVTGMPRLSLLPQIFITDVRREQASYQRGFSRVQRQGIGLSARYYLDDLAFRSFVQVGGHFQNSNIQFAQEQFVQTTYDGSAAWAWREVQLNRNSAAFGGQLLVGLQWAKGPVVVEGAFGGLVRQLFVEPKELNRFFTGFERALYGYYPFSMQANLKVGFRF